MKRYFAILIVTLIMVSSSFAQGEYLTNTNNGVSFGFNYGSADDVDIYSGQFGLSMNKAVDIGFGIGKTSATSVNYYYSRKALTVYSGYMNLHLPKMPNSAVQFSLRSAFSSMSIQNSFLISPSISIEPHSDDLKVKFYLSPGFINVTNSGNSGSLFVSFGISPYFQIDKQNLLVFTFSGTHTSSQNTISVGLGFLFGFGDKPKSIKSNLNKTKTDKNKEETNENKKKKKKKKTGSYYGG